MTEAGATDPAGQAATTGESAGESAGEPAGELASVPDPAAPHDPYLARVMAEIDEEARGRRREIPARVERELDELFLEHAPMGSRHGDVAAALRMVDAHVFIDPVVPVASQRPAGAAVKKGIRSLNLWYMGYVTHQVSQFAAAVSRSLHLVDTHLQELRRMLPPPAPAPVVSPGDAGSWWAGRAQEALSGADGRVLHAACGDGWLVRALRGAGVDAYGVDPRPGVAERAMAAGSAGSAGSGGAAEAAGSGAAAVPDVREEPVLDHLRAVGPFALGGLVLSGVVEGMGAPERGELLAMLANRLQDGGTLVVHSLTPAAWAREDAPPEADLAPGRPLRAATWGFLLDGWAVEVVTGPEGDDYLVVASR